MPKSQRLRLADVEHCFDLVEQCRELWADPDGWRQHLLRGICRLTGQAVGHYTEMTPASLGSGPLRFSVMADFGWRDDNARSDFLRYSQDMTGPRRIPFPGLDKMFAALAATSRSIMSRPEVCSDTDWYRSPSSTNTADPRSTTATSCPFSCNHSQAASPTSASIRTPPTPRDRPREAVPRPHPSPSDSPDRHYSRRRAPRAAAASPRASRKRSTTCSRAKAKSKSPPRCASISPPRTSTSVKSIAISRSAPTPS